MKKSFILYKDSREVFDELSNEQAGELIKAVFAYCDGEDPNLSGVLKFAFMPIKKQLERDLEKWKTKSEKAKKAADARWSNEQNADGCKDMQTHADAFQAMHSDACDAVNVNVNDNVNDNVTVNVSENVNDNKRTIVLPDSKVIDYDSYKQFWNDNLKEYGIPTVVSLSQARKNKIKTRLKNDPDFEAHFKICVGKITESDFLKGSSSKGNWKVSFDWVIENDKNYLKILEGNFSGESSSGISTESYATLKTMDSIYNRYRRA